MLGCAGNHYPWEGAEHHQRMAPATFPFPYKQTVQLSTLLLTGERLCPNRRHESRVRAVAPLGSHNPVLPVEETCACSVSRADTWKTLPSSPAAIAQVYYQSSYNHSFVLQSRHILMFFPVMLQQTLAGLTTLIKQLLYSHVLPQY